jgi:septum formation protein
MPATLILASSSPYRRELLERLGVPFSQLAPEVDESLLGEEQPRQRAERLAAEKALAGARLRRDGLVLGSDQVAACAGEIRRKPGSLAAARKQLAASSGRTLSFYTAVALARDGVLVGEHCVTVTVRFRSLTLEEIDGYLALEPALDCAGGFRWEALGIALFESIESPDPTALTGLPLIALCDLLRQQGINPLLAGRQTRASARP